jgi:hypothetical protein
MCKLYKLNDWNTNFSLKLLYLKLNECRPENEFKAVNISINHMSHSIILYSSVKWLPYIKQFIIALKNDLPGKIILIGYNNWYFYHWNTLESILYNFTDYSILSNDSSIQTCIPVSELPRITLFIKIINFESTKFVFEDVESISIILVPI